MISEEVLVRDYLAADSGVSALVGSRVYTHLPAEPTFPLVVLSLLAGDSSAWGHLQNARLQIEAWAEKGGRPTADQVFRAVRDAMKSQTIQGDHTLGVVSGAQEVLTRYFPDPVSGGRPRYLLDVRVWMHP